LKDIIGLNNYLSEPYIFNIQDLSDIYYNRFSLPFIFNRILKKL